MSKFLVVHVMSTPMTAEEAGYIGQKVKAMLTADAYWVKSWAQLNEDGKIVRILCEWNAVDEDAIRRVLDKLPDVPVEGIYPMKVVDSEDFR